MVLRVILDAPNCVPREVMPSITQESVYYEILLRDAGLKRLMLSDFMAGLG